MQTYNAKMIKLGRELRGCSQAGLSKESGISQGYLSKLENGMAELSEEAAKSISNVLKLPLSFFSQHERVYGLPVSVHPMHRKKASVGKKELEKLHAELNFRIMHLKHLLNSVDLSPEFEIPKLDPDLYDCDIEKIAETVRRHWLIPAGPIEDLVSVAENAGCIVTIMSFKGANIDGVTLNIPGLAPCIFLNEDSPADRMRFTLAHELGHLIMHSLPTPNMEEEANAFASAFLMPRNDIKALLSRVSIERLAYMKPIWKVSMASLLMRAKSLGKLTPNQSQYLWRMFSSRGYRTREPAELDFPKEQSTLLDSILEIHLKELGYKAADVAQLFHVYPDELSELYPSQFIPNNHSHIRLVK
jgi:Zn-dependent peptidase ImmA (M78 family)/transcriptional regulator with XRE-family HTH domain